MFSSILLPLIPIAIMVVVLYLIVRKFKNRGSYSPFTDDFLREPGETLRDRHDELQDKLMETFFSMAIIGIPAIYLLKGSPPGVMVVVLVVFSIFFVLQLWKLHRLFGEAVNVRLGFEGERATGQELMMLMRDGAWVFHDIPYQYGNIDHIIISVGGVFAVETKAVSKPESKTSSRSEWKVVYDGKTLKFPHYENAAPLEQAKRHAKHLHKHLKKTLGIHVVVTPVVALPGWFVDRTGKSDVWVINPKDRGDLRKAVTKKNLSTDEAERIAANIESVARSVRPGSKKLDPDASDYYDFWNNPRYKPPSVD